MEKTLEIDGKQVTFKSTGATAIRYKAQFGRDFLADILKMQKAFEGQDPNNLDLNVVDLNLIDFDTFYNIAWVLAKTANKSIPDPFTWLDSFDVFPMDEVIPELQDMISSTLTGKKK